jgi:hypothetical protein
LAEDRAASQKCQKANSMNDELLEWISFRQTGRIGDFQVDGHERTRGIISSNLSALGHIESLQNSGWRVAPPTLACIPSAVSSAFSGVLCGARTLGLLSKLGNACRHNGATIQVDAQSAGPKRILISALSIDVLADVAAQAGILFQRDAGYTLLACLPSISAWPRQSCKLPGGKVGLVKRFSGREARWLPATLDDAHSSAKGFYRIQRDWDWVNILKLGQSEYASIDERAGRLLTAAKHRHARWTPDDRKFSLPGTLLPPAYIARALVLCSGLLPSFDKTNSRITFSNIGPEMLRLILAITGLKLA